MIANLRPYPMIRDSGVVWLGEIPKGWDVLRGRQLFDIKKRISGELGHPIISVTQQGLRVKDLESGEGQLSQDYSKYQTIRGGEFAMNSMDLLTGGVGIASSFGVTSPDYRVFAIRDESRCCDKYILHVFRMLYRNRAFYSWGQGSAQLGRWRLPRKRFNDFPFPVPPFTEQAAIGRFLDWTNGRLERAIRAKRKVIALLNEQKQAIIHRAVTRGLDPSVQLKPSSVPWLGNVPQHWQVRRVASFAHKVTNGWVGPTREILREAGVPYLQSLHVKAGEIRFKKKYFVDERWLRKREKIRLRAGDVVVVQTGDVGQVAHIPAEFEGAGCHALIIIGTNLSVISGSYLSRVLNCWYGQVALKLVETGALLPHLNCGYVRDVQLPVPPIPEQLAIEKHLDSKLQPVSSAMVRLDREIELLHEYRTRLVADVVTGKLDVREAATRLPDEAPLNTVEDDADMGEDTEAADEEAFV